MIDEKVIKRFLIKKYYKEISQKRQLTSATIEILNFCNFKCVHCYNQNLKVHLLDKTSAFHIIDSLVEMGCKNVTITGGEPTLHPQFKEIYKHCYDKHLKITLFTNGFYLDRFVDFFKNYRPDKIEISIYGASDKTYKEVCQIDNGFNVVNRNIELLKTNNLPIYTKSVIMQQNYLDYDEIKKYVERLSLPYRIDLSILKSKDFNNNQDTNKLLDNQYYEMMSKIKTEKTDNWLDYLTREETLKDTDLLYSCGAGRISLFIASNGGIRLCNFAEFSEKNIKDYSLKEIWNSFNEYLTLNKDQNSKCYKCKYKKVCSNCPVTTYMEHKTDGKVILPVQQNCREAKFIFDNISYEQNRN